MYNRNYARILISLVITVLLLAAAGGAAASEKERMVERIPAINNLKDKGLVGENNQGYLEYRSASQPEKETVAAENNDRKSVYGKIAKSQGAKTTLVGQRRASQIAKIGSPGHWFQKSDGSWYKKK